MHARKVSPQQAAGREGPVMWSAGLLSVDAMLAVGTVTTMKGDETQDPPPREFVGRGRTRRIT